MYPFYDEHPELFEMKEYHTDRKPLVVSVIMIILVIIDILVDFLT